MLYRMSSLLLSGRLEGPTRLVDGMGNQKQLSRCSCPSDLVWATLILESAVDCANTRVVAGSRKRCLVQTLEPGNSGDVYLKIVMSNT